MSLFRSILVGRRFLLWLLVAGLGTCLASAPEARAVDANTWKQPIEPFHIAGPIYYVGTRGLSVFLITTSDGDILLGGAIPGTAPLIEASIRKLGFKPE